MVKRRFDRCPIAPVAVPYRSWLTQRVLVGALNGWDSLPEGRSRRRRRGHGTSPASGEAERDRDLRDPDRGPRARRRFGPRPDSVEPASDVTMNCFLSSTKEASWGFYEFFRLLLRVPPFYGTRHKHFKQRTNSLKYAWYRILKIIYIIMR